MKDYLSLVKFSHTIFALPFALVGYFLAVHLPEHTFSVRILILVLLCMVFARNAAMAFNRWQDRDIDGKNPRTAVREIPAGVITANAAITFVVLNCIAFVITTYFINPLCFYLSPVALLVILGYSYTKRFTALCHLVLGMGLALAPVGAYLAVTGTFALIPVLLGCVVLCWVAGFDIIYALQDVDFDASLGLRSTPVAVGKVAALRISTILHIVTALLMVVISFLLSESYAGVGVVHYIGATIFVALLWYQHRLVSPDDLSKVNLAFFTTNGVASVIYGGLLILDLYV